jgi:protein-L-isoaspartate(D-aspartate) O-methyltransferase
VGTGSGYQTAILCELLPLASTVRTIEILPELAGRAERTLRELGYENVEFRVGDGAQGWPEAAPYDAMVVAAAPEDVPAPLLQQLAPGGRLVIPVGPDPDHQELQLWHKLPSGDGFDRKVLMHVRFVPLTGHSNLH